MMHVMERHEHAFPCLQVTDEILSTGFEEHAEASSNLAAWKADDALLHEDRSMSRMTKQVQGRSPTVHAKLPGSGLPLILSVLCSLASGGSGGRDGCRFCACSCC